MNSFIVQLFYAKIKHRGLDNCDFCSDNFSTTNEIIKEFEYWVILYTKYNYFNERNHLLVIPKAHKEHTEELSPDEMVDFINVEKFMNKFYLDLWLDYFSFIRQTNGWKSIKHLHYHYLPWALYSNKVEEMLK